MQTAGGDCGDRRRASQGGPVVEDRGIRIACIPRGKPDRDGHREEFRVSLDECLGSPFIHLRLFVRGQDGETWFPTKKGCSVRLSEAEEVAEAILEALRIADSPGGGRVSQAKPAPTDRSYR
jgi:hypothetical protein